MTTFCSYFIYPKSIKLLRDRIINAPDEQLREWAQQQLTKMGGEERKLAFFVKD